VGATVIAKDHPRIGLEKVNLATAEEGAPALEVMAIKDKRTKNARVEYLVEWRGSKVHESSWVGYAELRVASSALVRAFNKEQRKTGTGVAV
jgi:hypothetical protein